MAIDLAFATGSAVTVSTTELSLISGTSTLQANTTAGIYEVVIDANAVTATESFEVKIYETVLAAGTKRVAHRMLINGVQAWPIVVYPSLLLGIGWDVTIKKLLGTDRALTWSIRKVA